MNSQVTCQVLALLLLLPVSLAELPNGECDVTGSTCELENDNVIGIIFDIASEEECQKECEDDSTDCRVYAYYGPDGVPYRDTCILFSNCTTLGPCEDCFTEELKCGIYCQAPVEGVLGDNQLDFIVDVSEAACEAECKVLTGCNFFSYHYENSSLFQETCFLLTELREPITYCRDGTCVSGSPDCQQSLCGYLDDGILNPNGIVITESKDVDLILIGSCGSPLAVAVGGGGTTQYDAGSGSGYVEFVELSINGPYRQFSATVGSAQQESRLTDAADGSVLLTANPGEDDGGGTDGAAGYSGGGADCDTNTIDPCSPSGDGGTDGADGGDSSTNTGGQGSGFDISTIPLRNFALR